MAGNGNGTAVAKKPPFETLKDMLERAQDKLAEVAPKHLKVDRMVRLLLSACSRNPKILECSPASVLQFAMKCSETGLEPIGAGGAWPIPYKNNKNGTTELTFMPDYRGLVNVAKHAGCVVDAFAEVVHENDEFGYELGLTPMLHHKPARGDRGALEAVYCVMTFPSGDKRFIVVHKEEIESIRNRSQAWQAFIKWQKPGPWNTDPAEMWKKTAIRRAMKPFAGMSAHLDAATAADDETSGLELADARPPVAMPRAVGELPSEEVQGETVKDDGEVVPAEPQPTKKADEKASAETLKLIMAEANELGHDQASLDKLAKECGASRFSTIRQTQAEALLRRLKGEPE